MFDIVQGNCYTHCCKRNNKCSCIRAHVNVTIKGNDLLHPRYCNSQPCSGKGHRTTYKVIGPGPTVLVGEGWHLYYYKEAFFERQCVKGRQPQGRSSTSPLDVGSCTVSVSTSTASAEVWEVVDKRRSLMILVWWTPDLMFSPSLLKREGKRSKYP